MTYVLIVVALCLSSAHSFSVTGPKARLMAPLQAQAAPAGYAAPPAAASLKRELLSLCKGLRNGVDADAARRDEIERVVQQLEPLCPPAPTEMKLEGTYALAFSTSSGGSSGKLGPFVGSVTQTFVDEKRFVNAVELGPLRIALNAEREVLDERRIRVSFVSTAVSLWGRMLLERETNGKGVWTQRYVDNELRVMDTPSLFVLRRRPSKSPSLWEVLDDPARFMEDED